MCVLIKMGDCVRVDEDRERERESEDLLMKERGRDKERVRAWFLVYR